MLAIQETAKKVIEAQTINLPGLVFMVVSVGFVTILMIWCFKKVLSLPPEEEKREEELLEHFHTG